MNKNYIQVYNNILIISLFINLMSKSLSLNTILLSRFSQLDSAHFRALVEQMKPREKKTLVYIPTASYEFNQASTRSRGDQRRRARYDARAKMLLLKEAFNIPNGHMLELDDPKIATRNFEEALGDAGIVYIDGGNTFYLQKHISLTGLWDVLNSNLENGMLYMGCSAGAIVAGKR